MAITFEQYVQLLDAIGDATTLEQLRAVRDRVRAAAGDDHAHTFELGEAMAWRVEQLGLWGQT